MVYVYLNILISHYFHKFIFIAMIAIELKTIVIGFYYKK